LKLLQAQIEPHFLFNTLANLDALIATDPKRARVMLAHLNDYLRATLAAARKARSSLGEEFALLRNYLEVLSIRMGPRLQFELALPEPLASREVPPMLLQPLVENAVQHGFKQGDGSGTVRIRAARHGDRLVLAVLDDGAGLSVPAAQATSAGLGLGNTRAMLEQLYGKDFTFSLRPGAERGTDVIIDNPYTEVGRSAGSVGGEEGADAHSDRR